MSCCDNDINENTGENRYRKILWIILALNAGMFFVEVIASFYSGSVALMADAVDFFSDAANYAISLYVLDKALATRAKASLIKGGTMGLFGLLVVGNSIYRAATEAVPQAEVMGAIGLLALLVNLGSALMLYRYREGDSNRESVWICSRNDAVGNILVMIAAAGVAFTQSHWPDILVAFIIAVLFLRSALHIFRSAMKELKEARQS
jgi:cation diffusion facilitator family transporter